MTSLLTAKFSSSSTSTSAESLSTWSDEDIERALMTVLVITIVTVVTWFFLIRPLWLTPLRRRKQNQDNNGVGTTPAQQQHQQHSTNNVMTNSVERQAVERLSQERQQSPPQQQVYRNDSEEDGSVLSLIANSTCTPPHLATKLSSNLHSGTVLNQGIIPFRHVYANTYESSTLTSDEIFHNRKERARLFTKLFHFTSTTTTTTPPPRGSNIVVTIPSTQVSCHKAHFILYLLGTYYNLFLLIHLPSQLEDLATESCATKEVEKSIVASIKVPDQVLPTHRILFTSSITGRVAFVRQLQPKPEFILDYQTEVLDTLSRFGFVVLLYNPNNDGGSESGIGKELLP